MIQSTYKLAASMRGRPRKGLAKALHLYYIALCILGLEYIQ